MKSSVAQVKTAIDSTKTQGGFRSPLPANDRIRDGDDRHRDEVHGTFSVLVWPAYLR